MIEVIFPAGFAPAEATLAALIATLAEISSDSPARSASAITGTRPANDTRFSSSNSGVACDQAWDSCTESAFRCNGDQDFDNPDCPCTEGTFSCYHAERSAIRSTDRG
jgi:hypothetical protein